MFSFRFSNVFTVVKVTANVPSQTDTRTGQNYYINTWLRIGCARNFRSVLYLKVFTFPYDIQPSVVHFLLIFPAETISLLVHRESLSDLLQEPVIWYANSFRLRALLLPNHGEGSNLLNVI